MISTRSISVLTLAILALAITPWAQGTELVYKPINPSFGGNPLNGNFLLSKAQAQNKYKANISKKSYAEKFQESLERAYINKMVREITNLSFGDNCDVATDSDCEPSVFAEDSTFTSGDYIIEIITSNTDSITVQITNSITDEITIIEVPRFS